jgi:hypothetical protein
LPSINTENITLRNLTRAARERLLGEARAQIWDELTVEIRVQYDAWIKSSKERVEYANRIIERYKGLMSRSDYMKILAATHPDHSNSEHAREAFELVKRLEKLLVKPEPKLDPTRPRPPPLPSTLAGLMAMRKRPMPGWAVPRTTLKRGN